VRQEGPTQPRFSGTTGWAFCLGTILVSASLSLTFPRSLSAECGAEGSGPSNVRPIPNKKGEVQHVRKKRSWT
jgi:hypothetical protein